MSSSDDSSDDDFDPRELEIVSKNLRMKSGDVSDEEEDTANAVRLEQKLADIALPADFGWIETLAVTNPTALDLENVHDDLKREAEFYARTLIGVKQAIGQFAAAKIPYRRPVDYFAEMVKPDEQMARIKDSLIRDKKRMSVVESRKKAKQSRKYAKAVHSDRLQEKAAKKRDHYDELNRFKKKNKNEDVRVGRSGPLDFSDKGRKNKDGKFEKSAKRKAKDDRYGRGGRKKVKKMNSADSSAKSAFNLGKNRAMFSGFNKDAPNKNKNQKRRPGKATRNARR